MKKEIKKDNKKQEKSLLICKILTAFSIGLSLLSILVGCSAMVDNSKQNDQIEKVSEKKGAYDFSNNFIYKDNYAYVFRKIDNYHQGFQALENYFINGNTAYLIFEPTPQTHAIYLINGLTAYNNYVDVNVIGDNYSYNRILEYSTIKNTDKVLFKFNQKYAYRYVIGDILDYVARIYHYADDTSSYYSQTLEYALQGAFHLTDSNAIYEVDLIGQLKYYDDNLSYKTYYFNDFNIDYSNGLHFNNGSSYIDLYRGISYETNKVFSLKNLNYQEGELVKITNLFLLDNELNQLPTIFIDTGKEYKKTYKLEDLYMSQYVLFITSSLDYEYYFNYTSNNLHFNRFHKVYTAEYPLVVNFEITVNYINDSENINVLDVRGVPNTSNVIGNATGIEYTILNQRAGFETFTIQDTYDIDIQMFQRNETYQSPIFENVGFEDSDIFDAFDLISGVFTSLLPFLNFAILPNITIGVLVVIPFAISLILFVVNIFKR